VSEVSSGSTTPATASVTTTPGTTGNTAAGTALPTTSSAAAGTTTGDTTGAQPSLVDVCPDPVVIQTDWYPQAEHGATYQLVAGPDAEIDAQNGRVRGPLGTTGIDVEIRVAGSFIGDNSVQAVMYEDDDVLLGYVNLDTAIKTSDTLPVVGVFQILDISPEILMFDPAQATYETVDDIADNPDAKILYYEGSASIDYLVGSGRVTEDQLDPSYDGSPSRFVTEDNILQQGFVSAEVYKYENEVEQWNKPVDYLLLNDAGYTNYVQTLSVVPEAVTAQAECLSQLVPVMQQAVVDYAADPTTANRFMVQYNEALDSSWTINDGLVDSGVEIMKELDILGNGPNDTVGDSDETRVTEFIAEVVPVFETAGIDTIKADLTPADLVTNEFIDPNIGL